MVVHTHSRHSLHPWDIAAAAVAAVCMTPSLVVNMAELVLQDQQ